VSGVAQNDAMNAASIGSDIIEPGFALFDTAIGICALAWGPRGLVGVQLPEDNGEAATRARMRRRFPELPESEPTGSAQQAVAAIQALLQGAADDLRHIVLDMSQVSEFHQRIYAIARRIPPGQTRTYGEIAAELGDKGLSRAVGQAMGHNPFAPVVPCHRVLAAGNKPGGFSAGGGALTKLRMLDIEGARPNGMASLF
jgi:methylated-DNA-[protein]-cysteine S-methyltransferase